MQRSTWIKFSGLLSCLVFFGAIVWGANNFPKLSTDQFTVTGATATTVPYFDASKHLVSSTTTPTQLGLLGTATSSNTVSTLVERDGSGNFSAGTITAGLTGNVTGNLTGNVTGNVTGNLTGNVLAGNGTAGAPSISFQNNTDSGLYRNAANDISMSIAGVQAMDFQKSGGGYGNVGLGGTASVSDFYPLFIFRTIAGTVNQQISNGDTSAGSGTRLQVVSDAGNNQMEISAFTAATTTPDIYNGGRGALRAGGSLAGMTLVADATSGSDIKMYAGGDAVANKIMTLNSTGVNTYQPIVMNGSSSGAVSIKTLAAAGTYSITYPNANASGFEVNNGSGTLSWRALAGSDLPNPSASTLGGIESLAAISHQWINTISTSGVPSSTQPAFTDISGVASAAQLPNPSASTLGGIESLVSTSHQWINTISTSGVPSSTQPAFSDISGTASATQGGTAQSTYTTGDTLYASATNTLSKLAIGSSNAVLTVVAGIPSWVVPSAGTVNAFSPWLQDLTSGTTYELDYVFTVTSANATVNSTYTNNGFTCTTEATIATGTTLNMHCGGAPLSSGTLTKSGGTGDSTITFSARVAAIWLEIKMVGGGAGGCNAAASAWTAAGAGGATTFGTGPLFSAAGGGTCDTSNNGGAGGSTCTITPPALGSCLAGGAGQSGTTGISQNDGGSGGSSCFGGNGNGGRGASAGGTAGVAAKANSGSGGGGGGGASGANMGAGGGAGACILGMLPAPLNATYTYAIGTTTTGGAGANSGGAGSSGGTGRIQVISHFNY